MTSFIFISFSCKIWIWGNLRTSYLSLWISLFNSSMSVYINIIKGIGNLYLCDSQKLHLILTFNIVRHLFKFITTPYQFKNFSLRLFSLHLVFYTEILVWTKFITLNNLMPYSLGQKKFLLWNLYDIFRCDVKS